jgi:diacylglycerol kinase family enzyme
MPRGAQIVGRDRAVGRLVEHAWARGQPIPAVGLTDGDLRRALGGRRNEDELRRDDTVLTASVDIGSVLVSGTRHAFVAHLVARARGWRGPVYAVMNSEWLGDWDVAPRAHPGDGFFDVVEARLSLHDRLEARRRLPTGTHLPHPSITVRKLSSGDIDFGVRRAIYVDGVRVGTARTVRVECHRGALRASV